LAPGDEIPAEALGAAHLFVARCLERKRKIPSAAIRFEEPLRSRGRAARGSLLYNPVILRQLLTWADPDMQPDLAIVLVDSDGRRDRKRELEPVIRASAVPAVLGVAVEEFESWLAADVRAVRAACGDNGFVCDEDPESMAPASVKQRLEAALGTAVTKSVEVYERRRSIAKLCDLDVVEKRCPSFAAFLAEL
jgi:hypothetical protein